MLWSAIPIVKFKIHTAVNEALGFMWRDVVSSGSFTYSRFRKESQFLCYQNRRYLTPVNRNRYVQHRGRASILQKPFLVLF
jgi:hypothetical protein